MARPTISRASTSASVATTSTRRKKGPSYLPTEHDALPPHVAFTVRFIHLKLREALNAIKTLNYPDPIIALDFSAPYDLLLASASSSPLPTSTSTPSSTNSSFSLSLHSLKSGRQLTYLRGHIAPVRALQVEERSAVTGSDDGTVRVWDLNSLAEGSSTPPKMNGSAHDEPEPLVDEFGNMSMQDQHAKLKSSEDDLLRGDNPNTGCLMTISAHSRPLTSLYFDGGNMVSRIATFW